MTLPTDTVPALASYRSKPCCSNHDSANRSLASYRSIPCCPNHDPIVLSTFAHAGSGMLPSCLRMFVVGQPDPEVSSEQQKADSTAEKASALSDPVRPNAMNRIEMDLLYML